MGFLTIFNKLIMILSITIIGYILRKSKVFESHVTKNLSTLIAYVTMPCLVLTSLSSQIGIASRRTALLIMVVSTLMFGFFMVISPLVSRFFAQNEGEIGIYRFDTIFNNNGFLGFPIINAIFGASGLFYAAIYNIPNNILTFTVGIYNMTLGKEKTDLRQSLKRILNPGMVLSVAAIVIFFAGIKLPDQIQEPLTTVGSMTTPLAMIVLGMSLADIPAREVFLNVRLYGFMLLKMLALPIILILVFRLVHLESFMASVLVILAAMPGATMSVAFAYEYDADVELASKYVFLSTLVCIVSIPLIRFLCDIL